MKLIAETLSVMRGDRMVVTQLSFAVDSGEALVLIGPNGAGKTTVIRAIAGLLQPSGWRRFAWRERSLSARRARSATMLGTSTA